MWVTEDEHRRLLERSDGNQLAAWIRQTSLDEKPARAGKIPSLSPPLLRQLSANPTVNYKQLRANETPHPIFNPLLIFKKNNFDMVPALSVFHFSVPTCLR
ncbi:hypothetical protein ACVGW7_00220, partial [Enterobacter intestinihominis]